MESDGAEHPEIMIVGEAPGCITGDSLIEVAYRDKSLYPDGIPIKELVRNNGFYVYAYDTDNNKLCVDKVNKVWKTGRKKVYRVTYEWKYPYYHDIVVIQDYIDVTSNHKFLLKKYIKHDPFMGRDLDVNYLSIDDGLRVGDSIQPFLRGHGDGIGVSSRHCVSEPMFLLEYKIGRELQSKEQCHHINRNHSDNTWDNLSLQTVSSHARLHSIEDNVMFREDIILKHKQAVTDPEYRKNMSAKLKEFYSNPVEHEKRLKQIQDTNEQRRATVKKLYNDAGFYYKYLMGRQRALNLSDSWILDKFTSKFPGSAFPVDNHKIVSIEYIGIRDVYDMEVATYHNFAVNGIFVHNSKEDEEGVPFVGESGKLLRDALKEVGFNLTKIRFTNTVRCRPKDNEKPDKKTINCCSQFAKDDIETYNPPLVFLMGNVPLGGILGESGISNWQGIKIEKNGRTYIPLFHPAYILRNRDAMDEWLSAMLKVKDGEETDKEEMEIILPKTLQELNDMYDYLYEYEIMAFDTETSSLDPYAENSKLLSISFAAGDRAYSYPLQHKDSWWTDAELIDVLNITRRTLAAHDGKLIGFNVKFDMMHIYARLQLQLHTFSDPMLISQLLDSVPRNHGLKRLAGIHLGMYKYDQELRDYVKLHKDADPGRGGTYDNVPLDILLPYGALDAEATILLDEKLYPQLSEKQDILYRQMIVPISDVLMKMQSNGFLIDQYIANRYLNIYNYRRSDIYADILDDPMVKKMIRIRTKKLQEKWNAPGKNGRVTKHKSKPPVFVFNPNSSYQVADLAYKYLKLKVLEYTKNNYPSVSQDALKPYIGKIPVISNIRYYGLLCDMISKYFLPASNGSWVSYQDKRVRSTYNIGGAVTGRLSSSDPNLQNIPAIESNPQTLLETLPIKNMFVSTGKNWLLAGDYSGMELRVFASVAHCANMLKIIKSGKDTHSCVAITSMTHKPLEEITEEEIKALPRSVRYVYKWTSWTLLFGGDAHTLSRLYDVPITDAEQTVRTYYDTFPEVLEYQKWCGEFAKDNGYIESSFGRKEYLPYINDNDQKKRSRSIREAVNMPIQSAASDTLLCSLVVIDKIMQERKLKSMLVNTVHDSIMLDCHPDEVLEVHDICVEVMENIATMAKHYMSEMDFSWLACPLRADVEIGRHYGTMQDFAEWERENVQSSK
jgi:uracil-DNA glycosylase family 4